MRPAEPICLYTYRVFWDVPTSHPRQGMLDPNVWQPRTTTCSVAASTLRSSVARRALPSRALSVAATLCIYIVT
mgnify:CR=1 FL=1